VAYLILLICVFLLTLTNLFTPGWCAAKPRTDGERGSRKPLDLRLCISSPKLHVEVRMRCVWMWVGVGRWVELWVWVWPQRTAHVYRPYSPVSIFSTKRVEERNERLTLATSSGEYWYDDADDHRATDSNHSVPGVRHVVEINKGIVNDHSTRVKGLTSIEHKQSNKQELFTNANKFTGVYF